MTFRGLKVLKNLVIHRMATIRKITKKCTQSMYRTVSLGIKVAKLAPSQLATIVQCDLFTLMQIFFNQPHTFTFHT